MFQAGLGWASRKSWVCFHSSLEGKMTDWIQLVWIMRMSCVAQCSMMVIKPRFEFLFPNRPQFNFQTVTWRKKIGLFSSLMYFRNSQPITYFIFRVLWIWIHSFVSSHNQFENYNYECSRPQCTFRMSHEDFFLRNISTILISIKVMKN